MLNTDNGAPIISRHLGSEISIHWDVDWHLKINGKHKGQFTDFDAADKAGKRIIEDWLRK